MPHLSPDASSGRSPAEHWRAWLRQKSPLLAAFGCTAGLTPESAVADYAAGRMGAAQCPTAQAPAARGHLVAAHANARRIAAEVLPAGSPAESGESGTSGGFPVLHDGAFPIAPSAPDIGRKLHRLGVLLDSRLDAMLDQIRIGSLLTQNMTLWLRVPDAQKERQYYIEQGYKHYGNSRLDPALAEIALDNLRKAEQLEATDYDVLHRIGMLYLYAEKVCDPAQAESYFRRAARFAEVEARPDAVRIGGLPADRETSGDDSPEAQLERIRNLALDSYRNASIAAAAQERFAEAIELARRAVELDGHSLPAAFQLVRALAQSGDNLAAGQALLELLPKHPEAALAVSEDAALMAVPHVQVALRQEARRVADVARERAAQPLQAACSAFARLAVPADASLARRRWTELAAAADPAGVPAGMSADDIQALVRRIRDGIEAITRIVAAEQALAVALPALLDSPLPAESSCFDAAQAVLLAMASHRQASSQEHRLRTLFDTHAAVQRLACRLLDQAGGVPGFDLSGHAAWVNALAFSPEGPLLASGSSDTTIRLWDYERKLLVGELKGHDEDVKALAFAAGGKLLASGSLDRTIRLWDLGSGLLRGQLNGHSGGVTSVALSPDGRLLASGSTDAEVRLWDTVGQRLLGELEGHSQHVAAVAFSPDGELLATAGRDRVIRLWQVATRRLLAELAGHSDWVESLAFSADSRLLASGGFDNVVRLWEVPARSLLACLDGHSSRVSALAFSPDGRVLASASRDQSVRLWDVATRSAVAELRGHRDWVQAVAFAPRGDLLASGACDMNVRLWDPRPALGFDLGKALRNEVANAVGMRARRAAAAEAARNEAAEASAKAAAKVEAARLFAAAEAELQRQRGKWFGKDFAKARELFAAAARLGHPSAAARARALA